MKREVASVLRSEQLQKAIDRKKNNAGDIWGAGIIYLSQAGIIFLESLFIALNPAMITVDTFQRAGHTVSTMREMACFYLKMKMQSFVPALRMSIATSSMYLKYLLGPM